MGSIIIEPPQAKATASVIWLHGLGASAAELAALVPVLDLPAEHSIRFVFPQAPDRPVSVNNGYVMPAWYDIYGFNYGSKEDVAGLDAGAELIAEYIQTQNDTGILSERIVLAGFSQGGALTLHTGLRLTQKLAGLIALSCYLPVRDLVVQAATEISRNIPLFMGHGRQDDVVPYAWGREACDYLTALNYCIDWHAYEVAHSITPTELTDIRHWLVRMLCA